MEIKVQTDRFVRNTKELQERIDSLEAEFEALWQEISVCDPKKDLRTEQERAAGIIKELKEVRQYEIYAQKEYQACEGAVLELLQDI